VVRRDWGSSWPWIGEEAGTCITWCAIMIDMIETAYSKTSYSKYEGWIQVTSRRSSHGGLTRFNTWLLPADISNIIINTWIIELSGTILGTALFLASPSKGLSKAQWQTSMACLKGTSTCHQVERMSCARPGPKCLHLSLAWTWKLGL